MEPLAGVFILTIVTAALTGVVVGAIGGAVVWRVRSNLALGGLLTAGAYLLVQALDGDALGLLRARFTWGLPAAILAFLVASVSARWIAARTTLRPTWITLAAFGLALGLGFLYLFLFRVSPWAPRRGAVAADVCLILLLMRSPWLARP
ncbi:MAG: hypothetical protein ACREMO_02385 [Gemmatimonadales bacterium]